MLPRPSSLAGGRRRSQRQQRGDEATATPMARLASPIWRARERSRREPRRRSPAGSRRARRSCRCLGSEAGAEPEPGLEVAGGGHRRGEATSRRAGGGAPIATRPASRTSAATSPTCPARRRRRDLGGADVADAGLVADPGRSATRGVAWSRTWRASSVAPRWIGGRAIAPHRAHDLARGRRRRDVRAPSRAEGLEHERDEPPPGVGRRRPAALDDAGIGHEQQDEILGDEVWPAAIRRPVPARSGGRRARSRASDGPPWRPRVGECPRQHVLQPPVGRLHRADPLDIARRNRPRRRLPRAPPRPPGVLGHRSLEAGGDQVVAARETGGRASRCPRRHARRRPREGTSRPRSANAAWAASTIRPRLRSASTRSGFLTAGSSIPSW